MTVNEGGMSCIAKAARYAISIALCSFLNETDIAKMRLGSFFLIISKSHFLSFILAGLLTSDRRAKERKKPGREGARRRYTWVIKISQF